MNCKKNKPGRAVSILEFLQECENNCWSLDNDDITHILSLDFDYIRKQEELISEKETQEILK